jgi:RecA-family ATPase
MGLFSKPQKTDFPDLPDNLYVAKLAKIANKIGKNSGKPYTSWGFELVQPPFVKRWVWGNTQPTVSPKSQTGKYLTALGVDISAVDENFNEQTLIGKYIKVLVETTENEETGDKFQNVTKLMPLTDADIQLLQVC